MRHTQLGSLTVLLLKVVNREYGVDARALAERAGIDSERLGRPDARLPVEKIRRLWEMTGSAVDDPAFGLRIGAAYTPVVSQALGFAQLASPTLREAVRLLIQYHAVLDTNFRPVFQEGPDEAVVRLGTSTLTGDTLPELTDAIAAATVKMSRLMKDDRFAPAWVSFKHGSRGNRDAYEAWFRCPVAFDARRNAVAFTNASLDEALPHGNVRLALEQERIIRRYLETLSGGQTTLRVREHLVRGLQNGAPSEEAVARALARSVSSLQRDLRAEGTSYRELLTRIRKDLATELLAEDRLSIAQVAFMTGYADQSAFSRAFKTWTGRTPSRYRQDREGN
jgi:AraC-like DNA-binding protein